MADETFGFADELDVFDPFGDEADGAFEDEDLGGDQVPDPAAPGVNPNPIAVPRNDDRPAAERLEELLGRMNMQRRTCVGVLRACEQPQPAENVAALVAQMQRGNASVFDAAGICSLLERAGGLERVNADGTPYPEAQVEPQVEVVDGVEYLVPAEPPVLHWRSTQAGLEAAAGDDPDVRLQEALEGGQRYWPIYVSILEAASAEGGVTVRALIAALDRDPVLQKPRRSCTHFVEVLRQAEALDWDGAWRINERGSRFLEQLRAQMG